jgi:RNA polymerase sigma factor for flagellar operon FliA
MHKLSPAAAPWAAEAAPSPTPPRPERNDLPGDYGDYRAVGEGIDEADAIRRHMTMVKRLAAHLRGRMPEAVQLDDLVQAGLMAVLRIMRQSPYQALNDAALRRAVINAMVDEIRRESWAPVRILRLAKTAAEAMRSISRRTGRPATDQEIAAEMGISAAEYQRVLVEIAGIRLLPLDGFEEGDGGRLGAAETQETQLDRRRTMAALAAAITGLPEREKLVISLYYEHELNMEEAGKVLGLDKSTICRAHGRALLMLRAALGEAAATSARPRPVSGG